MEFIYKIVIFYVCSFEYLLKLYYLQNVYCLFKDFLKFVNFQFYCTPARSLNIKFSLLFYENVTKVHDIEYFINFETAGLLKLKLRISNNPGYSMILENSFFN